MYCVNCGVRLQEGEEACPLCGTAIPAVVKPEARPAYPDRYPLVQKQSRALVVWLLTAVMAAVGLGCLVFCLRTMHRAAWSGIVLMSLDDTNKEIARRILDFMAGAAYATDGKIARVSSGTYIITPKNVDMMGSDMMEELENSGLFF